MRTYPTEPFTIAAFGFLALFLARMFWFRRRVNQLLEKSEPVDKEAIDGQLEEINREARTVTYLSNRARQRNIRGRMVTINDGTMGMIGPAGQGGAWRTTTLLFVIEPVEDVKWFTEQTDIFEPLFRGARHSVFQVNAAKLEKEAQ